MLFNPQILAQMLYESPERSGKSLRQVSREMGGIDERYLSRQLNPHDDGAKLGVLDFVFLASVTDLAVLDHIEKVFDRIAITIPKNFDRSRAEWLKHIADITKASGDCISSFSEAIADDDFSKEEREECSKKVYEAMKALASLYQELQQ